MVQNNSLAIILAAGKGTRMNTNIPKPLVKVNNRPIISWLIDDFKKNNTDIALVVTPLDKKNFSKYNDIVRFVFQNNPKGTGHAVMQASNLMSEYRYIYVFVGDCPFVGSDNISNLYNLHVKNNNDITILSSIFRDKKFPYARIIRDENGSILECVEEINATDNQKLIQELFCSHYIFKADILYKYLKDLKPNSKTGEIYFTDIINNLIKNNKSISSLNITDWRRLVGLNTQKDLEWMQSQNMI